MFSRIVSFPIKEKEKQGTAGCEKICVKNSHFVKISAIPMSKKLSPHLCMKVGTKIIKTIHSYASHAVKPPRRSRRPRS